MIWFIHESVADFVLGQQNTLLSNPACAKAAQAKFHLPAFPICSKVVQRKLHHGSVGPEPAMLPYAAQFWMLRARKAEAAMADGPAEECEALITQCGRASVKAVQLYKESFQSGGAAFRGMHSADVPNHFFIGNLDCLAVLPAFEGCTRLVSLHLQGECDRCCGSRSDAAAALPMLRQAVSLAEITISRGRCPWGCPSTGAASPASSLSLRDLVWEAGDYHGLGSGPRKRPRATGRGRQPLSGFHSCPCRE